MECAIKLHPQIQNKIDQIKKIELITQESAVRIISKSGPLHNPADRDHCLQYMVAVALLQGNLKADYYEDSFAMNPAIDRLREKMVVQEDPQFTKDYLDPEKRSIANSIQIFFQDGSHTEKVSIEYPVGHKRRREEGIPLMFDKFEENAGTLYPPAKVQQFLSLFKDQQLLEAMPVNQLMDLFVA